MNSKIRSRKIGLKAYFKAILYYFGLLPLTGSTADGFGGGSGIICHSLIISHFFRDSWFISHCFIQKAENDLKLYMPFCFAPCVKLMFWYKISLTLTNKRASKRSDTEIVFSVDSLTLTLAQSTCIRCQLSEQIIVYVFSARKFIVHTLYTRKQYSRNIYFRFTHMFG